MQILWLKSGPLHPVNTGGRKRTYYMLRELRKSHKITYLALDSGAGAGFAADQTAEYCDQAVRIPFRETPKNSPRFYGELLLNLFDPQRLPYILAKYQSTAMEHEIRRHARRENCDVVLCDFLTPAVNLFPERFPRLEVPVIVFQHNVESNIWRTMVEDTGNPLMRLYLRSQFRRMRRWEEELCNRCEGVIAVSEDDARTFREDLGMANVLGAVETGVDVEFFAPDNPANGDGAAQAGNRQTLAFLGSMDWLANIRACEQFLADIWPRIVSQAPEARFKIIGRNPPEALREKARRAPGNVELTGTVDDVRPHLAGSAAMVVPLRIGGGTRIKIFEALAMGVPVVSTTLGAEGLGLENRRHALIADAPEAFANACLEALQQPAALKEFTVAARDLILRKHSWPVVTRHFEDLITRGLEQEKRARIGAGTAARDNPPQPNPHD